MVKMQSKRIKKVLEEKKFQKKLEDFKCENCKAKVKGNGYTNHCPNCLWSKHVDINPGDRQEACGGLMEPIGLELEKGTYIIRHRCTKCEIERNIRCADNDSTDALVKLSESLAKKAMF